MSDPLGSELPHSGSEPDLATAEPLFRTVDSDGKGFIYRHELVEALEGTGLQSTDVRLAECFKRLGQFKRRDPIYLEQFAGVIAPALNLIERALQGDLIVSHWADFCETIREIYEETRKESGGRLADYIPVLARADPGAYGLAICTVDGQMFELGDAGVDVCVQSCSKPITYLAALMDRGEEFVHTYVGREPSGVRFNALVLNEKKQPHNPYINAGAIMISALYRPERSMSDRFQALLTLWKRLAGGLRVGFSNTVYLSERGTASRNFALAYLMQAEGSFPPDTDLVKTLELYFQSCAIEINCRGGAVIASTLANDGVCPLTGERVIPDGGHVRNSLSLALSCGMYDFSGEFAFTIGLPAKSGVSGLIMLCVPGVMGICIYSPPLDPTGNSVRGLAFCRELVRRFPSFHRFGTDTSVESVATGFRAGSSTSSVATKAAFLHAAYEGDVGALRQLLARGTSPNVSNDDSRTALHMAAVANRGEAAALLLKFGADPGVTDRWGVTPLEEARRNKSENVIRALGAPSARAPSPPAETSSPTREAADPSRRPNDP